MTNHISNIYTHIFRHDTLFLGDPPEFLVINPDHIFAYDIPTPKFPELTGESTMYYFHSEPPTFTKGNTNPVLYIDES